jgi:hypothetical protein
MLTLALLDIAYGIWRSSRICLARRRHAEAWVFGAPAPESFTFEMAASALGVSVEVLRARLMRRVASLTNKPR